jgi:TRAP-type C4-dicarboxylate transport system substrate-binding protein
MLTVIFCDRAAPFHDRYTYYNSESTANNIFNYWQKILEKALPASLLEQVKKWEENEEEIKKKLTEYELIVDSEEQEIERSLSYQEQKKYYSGKKKIKKYHPKEYLSNI